MKKITFLILLFCFSTINAQKLWVKQVNSESSFAKSELTFRKSFPKKFNIYSLDIDGFKNSLATVSRNKSKTILLPSGNGKLNKFIIKEDSNFSEKLSLKFKEIKSYSAQGLDDPTAIAKISVGLDGVHVMIMSGKHSTFYIDPYTKDNSNYISYNRESIEKNNNDFECELNEDNVKADLKGNKLSFAGRNSDDGNRREYRLALVCSGEYAQYHLNAQGVSNTATDVVKKAAVLSAMNTSMARINGVYERDLNVRMIIVSNNEDVIFLNAATDNITDGSAGTMINEVQTICDNVIGSANYDIGHIFSTGGSGLAGLGVVCVNGQKARGVTGIATPIGDPYDIDYVAHEIGHQFGATHTQNNSCNRTNSTAVEPGSASTIMGYAGICAPNVQNNSDDHFHAVSIDQMWSKIQSTANCGSLVNVNNNTPTSDAGLDVNIPKSTPFVLRGVGTDADGTGSLTYNWEQQDNEISTQAPLATSTGGPNFRSLPSSVSPDRYMPALPTVISGSTSSLWEVVPSVARTMNFSLVVRDNKAGGGSSARDDMQITVTDANPFTVTSQNSAVTWDTGTSQTITWDKSTTDVAPINCANVRIKLSTDGGVTFPITLVESTPNDGTHDISVPNNPTSSARIMVEAVGNIFYNVNSTNFTINSTTPTFILTNTTAQQNACNSGGASVSYTLNFDFINGFSESVTFTTSNEPSGSNVSFSPSTISSDGNVTMTVNNFDGATAQLYTIGVTGTSGTTSVVQNVDAELLILSSTFSGLTLTSPTNGNTGESLTPTLQWDADSNAVSYDVEVATDNSFSNIVASQNVTTNSYSVTGLNQATEYFWRVKPKNDCGEGVFSSEFSFTTQNCNACASSGNTAFETGTTLVQFNTIDNATAKPGGYSDYTSISTTVDKGASYDLTVNVNTDDGATTQYTVHTVVWIDWNQDCDFDDANETYDLGSATGTANGPTDLSPLSIMIPNSALDGNTVMRISSRYNTDPTSCQASFDGEVEDYTLEVQNPAASIEDFAFSGFSLYPNPSNGEMNLSFEVINTDKVNTQLYDLRGRRVSQKTFKNVSTQFSETLVYDNVSAGIYLLRISNGGKVSTRKIIIK